jgi:hypothetical protein
MTTSAISLGWEIMTTCEPPLISVTVAPMGSELKRWTPGSIHLSAVPNTAQAGRLRHAGVGAASVSATPARGRWEIA